MSTTEHETAPPTASSAAEVVIWTTDFEKCRHPSLLDRYAAILSESERARSQRFVFERDRHAYLVSHALVRTVLAEIVNAEPGALLFEQEHRGKPFLCHSHPLTFNLSHTQGMAVLCTAAGRAVGIDVEHVARPAPLEVADRYFSAIEVRELAEIAPEARSERFWSLWTLKEAYLKATGDGLYASLGAFSFAMNNRRELAFTTETGDGSRWCFAQWWPSPFHMAAVCLEAGGATRPAMRFNEIVPLGERRDVPVILARSSGHSG